MYPYAGCSALPRIETPWTTIAVMDGMEVSPKRVKKEPQDFPLSSFAYDDFVAEAFSNVPTFDPLPPAKHSASPAQEATRARISTFESQLNRLYRLRSVGKLDPKGVFQIRCLEDDLRKAHSKLRRLLNEAERQRRRRERLRSCSLEDAPPHHDYPQRNQSPDDRSIMAALRNCGKFEDFVRELRCLGFSLTRMNHDRQTPHTFEMPEEVENDEEEVRVHVELIEGDGLLENTITLTDPAEPEEIKVEPPPSPSSSEDPLNRSDPHVESELKGKSWDERGIKTFAEEYARKHVLYMHEWQTQYQDWFQKQMESLQQWEETFKREQIELAKSMLESVTSTFLQGIQQVLQNVVMNVGRRPLTPFFPTLPRNFNIYNSSPFMDAHGNSMGGRSYSETSSRGHGMPDND